jgi:hypothetical protein
MVDRAEVSRGRSTRRVVDHSPGKGRTSGERTDGPAPEGHSDRSHPAYVGLSEEETMNPLMSGTERSDNPAPTNREVQPVRDEGLWETAFPRDNLYRAPYPILGQAVEARRRSNRPTPGQDVEAGDGATGLHLFGN